jgi:hypothetical protein
MNELFLEKPCDHFICGLCAEVMKNPVQCPQGHTFCRECFTTALSIRSQCPIRCSEQKLEPSMLVMNRIVGDMIGDLHVRCSGASQSLLSELERTPKKAKISPECAWTGQFKDLPHHQKECLYIIQRCPNIGCPVQIQKMDIPSHLQCCEYRQVLCPLCGDLYQYLEALEHQNQCSAKLIDCPNGCITDGLMTSIPQSQLRAHLQACDNEVIFCQYQHVGCLFQSKRIEMESHHQDLSLHFPLLFQTVISQQNQIRDLTNQIQSLSTVTAEMVFTIPEFRIDQIYTSHRQRIAGIEYYLIFQPNSDHLHHSVFLVFPELAFPVMCRTICSLCKPEARESSHTRRSIFAEYTPTFYYKAFSDFIPSSRILTDGFLKSDGSVTIIETIVMQSSP